MDADSTQKPLSAILDEIEERANKATEGPWDSDTDDLATWINAVAHPQPVAKMGSCTHFPKKENAEFIASARTDVPALVKALRRAEQTFQFEINRANDWSSINARDALLDITAILNQGRSVGDNKGSDQL